ncbi:MAG TPA: hypothetical protein VJN92_17925 [Candidatus Acidoferrum sp.]|nr:hypothetical protein [Candidatus Acidoferrum sp.]
MKVLVSIFGFVLSLFVSSCRAQTQAPALLLHEVTVIDATGVPPRRGVDVLIRGERIEKLIKTEPLSWDSPIAILPLRLIPQ